MEVRVGDKFRMGRKIGAGSFGDIYVGYNVQTGEEVAIKLESVKARHPQLLYESKLYKILQGGVGIPNLHWYGVEGDYNIMVLDMLGPSLEDLFSMCERNFTLKTVLMLADQLIDRVEYVHSKNFLHRDLKPENFLIGRRKRRHVVYIIDFGLAKKFRDVRHVHIPYRDGKNLTGTARYVSINTHQGMEQSRRDDLEGLGYILMYFCGGSLPWQGLRATGKKDKYEKIMEKKMATTPDLLCRDYPPQFCEYLRYCRNMEFTQEPDYAALRRLFKDLLRQKGFHYDFMFDWTQQTTQRSLTSGTSAGRYSSQLPPPGREGQFVAGQALDVPGPTQQDEAGPNQPSNVRNPSAAAPTAGGPPSSMNRPVGHTAPPRGKYAGEEPRSAGVRQQHVIPTQNSRDVSSVQVYIRDEVPRSGEGRQAMLPSSAMIPHPALRNVDAPRRASRGYEESRSPQGRRERYYDPEAPESYNRRKGNRIEEVEFEDGKPHDGHDQDDLCIDAQDDEIACRARAPERLPRPHQAH
eukprot:GHVT01045037.1.p1 GENE.GHVT01045037.1~~GHVT01045037.1.p1  ORF type:complete len:522 (-),score=50.74 GHVT01045037.1:561-2126(-)